MKTVLIIIVFTTVFTNAENNNNRIRRFMNGKDAALAQFPYLASLRTIGDNEHFCGGSIINEQFILTAAHCLNNKGRHEFYIVVGTTRISYWRKRYWVDKFSIHARHNSYKIINDIALIKLKKRMKFSKYIQKVLLAPLELSPKVGSSMTVAGFGRVRYNKDNSETLQYSNVTSISLKECKKEIKPILKNHYITNKHLCTLDEDKGFCSGDSGGPLIYQGRQVGVVSWMMYPCALGYPDVYVKVTSYLHWIEKTMKKLNDKQ